MVSYSVSYAGIGQGWYVTETTRGARTVNETKRVVAGPYTSRVDAERERNRRIEAHFHGTAA